MEHANAFSTAKRYYIDDRKFGESRDSAKRYFEQYVALMTEHEGVEKGERALSKRLIDYFTKNTDISRERVKEMVYEKVKRNIFVPIPEKEDLAFRASGTSKIGEITLVDPSESGLVAPTTFFADSETIVIKEETSIPFSDSDSLGRLPRRLFTLLQISQFFRLYIARIEILPKLNDNDTARMKMVLREERERLRSTFYKIQKMKRDQANVNREMMDA